MPITDTNRNGTRKSATLIFSFSFFKTSFIFITTMVFIESKDQLQLYKYIRDDKDNKHHYNHGSL